VTAALATRVVGVARQFLVWDELPDVDRFNIKALDSIARCIPLVETSNVAIHSSVVTRPLGT
jgi:hypothetical protein